LQKFHQLKISNINEETTNAVAITFDIPSHLTELFSFKSGQYITLRAKIKGELIARSYSICSSPQSELLIVAVKSIKGGVFSNYANDVLRKGDLLEVSRPEGRFIFENDNSKKIFCGIAAGSGITPILSIIKDTLSSNTDNKFVLLYSNKSIAETMFFNDIKGLESSYSSRFYCHNIYSRENVADCEFGRIDSAFINYCLKQHSKLSFDKFFLCGPEELTLSISDELNKLGYEKNKILFELFFSKSELKLETNLGGDSMAKITCDYEDFEITIPKNMTILDAALSQKIDVPYSCQGGVCSSCIGKITSGTGKMLENNILTDSEIQEGLVLACQTVPTSQNISIDFDDV
jgi:ring-1,2-phenylacetyl-CoA epoxidase subunit PaaE